MSERTKRLSFSTMKRNAPRRGPTSSDSWNDTFDEVIYDLSSIQNEWNNRLLVLTDSLPDGTDDSNVDAWKKGLDGTAIYVDSSLTNTSLVQTFFDTALNRPVTIKEALEDIYDEISSQVTLINTTIAENMYGLTTAQKASIGAHIFDSTQSSSSTSIDGKSEACRLNLIQVARDVYGSSYSLDGDGAANLTNSVYAMVDALLELHNGNWDDDITLSHTGTGIASAQTDVDPSVTYDDAYAGTPGDLQDDLNQIRTQIKTIGGTTTWITALSSLYAGGANSLEDLLASTYGSGTKTSSNPWGYTYSNVEGLTTILSAVRDFIGQGSYTDGSPLYSGQRFITNGQPLEFACSKLDQELYDHMLDGHLALPVSEHWADSIQVETATRVPHADLQDLIEWQCVPGTMTTGEQFRRYEEGFSGASKTITHNRGSYPVVQLVQIDPPISLSGMFPYEVRFTSVNAFSVVVPSGVTTVSGFQTIVSSDTVMISGVVVALW